MPKLATLRNNELKEILKEYDLPVNGTKAEMVKRLIEHLQSDEIDSDSLARILPQQGLQQQFEELKQLVLDLANATKNNQHLAETNKSNPEPDVSIQHHENSIHAEADEDDVETVSVSLPRERYDGSYMIKHRFSVKEIAETIPEYDPTSDNSVSAEHFVMHIEGVVDAYEFEPKSLLLAVYSRLKGVAKIWLNGRQTLFTTWNDFKESLLDEFGLELNEAEISAKMMNCTRRNDEKAVDYTFKMMALGRRFGLSELAMVKYTKDGLRHRDLQNAIAAIKFKSMKEMRKAIMEYEQNMPNTSRRSGDITQNSGFGSRNFPKDNVKIENRSKPVVCYNCNETGHISKNCQKPQRKDRCGVCQKTSHKTEDCYNRPQTGVQNKKPNVNAICEEKDTYNDVIKIIKVNDRKLTSFIDSGSARSLIRETASKGMTDLEDCNFVLKGFAGSKYVAHKKLNATLEIDKQVVQTSLYIVNDHDIPENVLIGRDVLCKEGTRFVIGKGKCSLEANVLSINNGINGNVFDDNNNNDELRKLINNNKQCFADNIAELGKCSSEKMIIKLKTDEPVNLKPYRIAFAKRNIVSDIINDLLNLEIIQPSKSDYASPVVLVDKKNGEHRLCIDYRSLNKITIKMPYPMPVMEEQFAQLTGNSYYTTLDLRMGYHQIEMHEDSKQYTAFITTDGHYEFNRMPFGLVNAPAVFQRVMNTIINQMERGEALAYLDDVIIPCKTIEQGMKRLTKFFALLTAHGLTLRRDKCKFFQPEIEHLGYIVNKDGVLPGRAKLSAIRDFPTPKNITEVRRFLGLTGFFRKFVLDYALITKPITKLLNKTERENFNWTSKQQDAFELLINKLTNAPLLELYDVNQYHEIHTDACSIGLAGMLLQSKDDKIWRPVAYFSRHCNSAEQRYHSYELEVLAVVETVERFRLYLLGKPFRVVTDCAAIALTKEKRELKPRIARWWMKMQEYDMEIVHRAGSRLAHVDALSRAPTDPPKLTETAGFTYTIEDEPSDWIAAMQYADDNAKRIVQVLLGKIKTHDEIIIKRDFVLKNKRLYRKINDELKLYVPKLTRWKIINHFHDEMGHFALEKTLYRIKEWFWFPNMRKLVKGYVKSCIACCYNKSQSSKVEGELHVTPPDPIPFRLIHIDHVGPFIRSKRGYIYILTISDAFTKFCLLKPVKNTKTAAVIIALNEVISIFGLPSTIVSDRGPAFTSKNFQQFCVTHDIKHIQNAVRTPRANGQAERTNETLLNALRCSTKDPKEWDTQLINIQWSINSQPNSTTKFTPNELIFNYKINDISNNYLIAAIMSDVPGPINVVTSEEKYAKALDNIAAERTKWKDRFDRKHAPPTQYNEGDLIVIRNEPQATGESRKLEPKYRGPYMVAKRLGNDRYVITDIPGNQVTSRPFNSVFASDLMKPWCCSYPELANMDEDDKDDSMEEEETRITTVETPECQSMAELSHEPNIRNNATVVH